ncbi:MAG: hypothetical protein R3A48_11915 [Polyangiales bacterium]
MRLLGGLPKTLVLLSLVAGCATNSGGVLTPGGDAGADGAASADGAAGQKDGAASSDAPSPAGDAAVDVAAAGDVPAVMDAPAVDMDAALTPDAATPPADGAGADVVIPGDRVGGCTSDESCASNELGLNRCDVSSGRCVQCLPSGNDCPADQYCDPNALLCVRGCRDDSSCATTGADGGASMRRCDPTTRRCVDCVVDGDCGSGSLCVGGVCVTGCSGGRGCGAGESCCSGACINTASNVASCGACGNVCRVANGSATCEMGRCEVGACDGTRRDCDRDPSNGCETDTLNDINHCGSCGRVCPSPPNAAGSCSMGVCGFACNVGFADCNGVPEDGCEVNLDSSPENCGRCMNRCVVNGATAACTAGQCAVGACGQDQADCDGDPSNGCETNTRTSTAHCGMCGNRCPTPANGTPTCNGGTCGIGRCNDGYGDCDNMPGNGCETPLDGDPANCGACGRVCVVPNASPVCMNGTCGIGMCNPGFADCNGDPADGCEVDTRTSNDHCGACGSRCGVANGTPMCTAGVCRIGACNPGFADCNGRVDDGCETPVNFDPNNCGSCGNSCPTPTVGSRVCRAGTCAIGSCPTGFEDCDMNSANGCEVSVLNDLNNCGACGRRCPTPPNAAPSCVGGACGILRCNAGWADCDGNPVNGCETNITLPSNCGRCGNACRFANAGALCTAGACALGACNAGYGNCDGQASNGCEVSLTANTSNCGSCGNVCRGPSGASVSCVSGACRSSCPTGQSDCSGVCRATGASCTSAGSGGCAQTGSIVCSGQGTRCTAVPRTSGSCTSPVGGVCNTSGSCVCASGNSLCSGRCVNLQTDRNNCGACGRACATNAACVSGVCVGQGSLRFTLTWNISGDMDLHVRPPCGTEIYYGRLTACGGRLDRDDLSGRGPENIFWDAMYTPGRYYVCPEAYSSTVANATWTLVVVRNGVEVARRTGVRGRRDGNVACGSGTSGVQVFDL